MKKVIYCKEPGIFKTVIKFFYLVACVVFIIACNETYQSGDELSGVSLKSASSECPVFVVYPNGTDDTGPLMQAFADAHEAGPGSVVQLVEGEYFIGFIEIREFTGSLIGAGKGKTIIKILTGLDCDNITIVEKQFSYVLKYIGGDVYVADLTFLAPSGGICSTGNGKISGFLEFSDYQTGYNSSNMHIKACVNNVEFIGQPLTVNGLPNFNISKGIRASCDSNGPSNLTRSHIDITITNCSFNTIEYAVQYTTINNGSLVLGKQSNGNSFSECRWSANLFDIINVPVSVTGNVFYVPKDGVGLQLSNGKQPKFINELQQQKIVCNVERNSFKTADGGKYAIEIYDIRRALGEQIPMLVQLKNNTIELEGGASVGINCGYLTGMVIRNNQFKGSSTLPGVRIVGAGTTFNEDGLLLGNNFSNFISSLYTVLLNDKTRNWSIVGGDLGESVNNLGVNNFITGMNVDTSGVPFGQTITDNLEDMRDGMNF